VPPVYLTTADGTTTRLVVHSCQASLPTPSAIPRDVTAFSVATALCQQGADALLLDGVTRWQLNGASARDITLRVTFQAPAKAEDGSSIYSEMRKLCKLWGGSPRDGQPQPFAEPVGAMGGDFYFTMPLDAEKFVNDVVRLFGRLSAEGEVTRHGHARARSFDISSVWRGLTMKKGGVYFTFPLH
jgi:hypothetical protein